METNIQYNIKVNDGNAVQTIGQLENEVDGLNTALKLVKPNSQQFKELTKQSQAATKQLAALNKEVEGITLEDKLDAADGAIKTLAGSTQALVGGFGLLGIESEKLAFLEGKAADAIAFGMGLKDLSEGFGKLAKSTAVANVAQKAYNVVQIAFNAIMSLNPLGILLISLTAIGGLIFAFRDKILNLIKTALGPFQGIIDKIVGAFTALGEAIGIVETAEEKLAKQMKANRTKQITDLERQIELEKARGNYVSKLEEDLHKLKLLNADTQDQKSELLHQEDLRRIREKVAADEEAKKTQEQKDREAIERRKAEIAEMEETAKTLEKSLKTVGVSTMGVKSANEQLADSVKSVNVEMTDEHKAMKTREAQQNFQISQEENVRRGLGETAQALGNLGAVLDQESAASKSLALGSAIINTYLGVTEALRQKSTLPSPFDVITKVANVATILAVGFKSVNAIKSTPPKSSGGSKRDVSAPTRRGSGAPQGTQTQSTLQPIDVAEAQIQNQNVSKTYVLAGNVRSEQEADSKIKAKRSID